MLIVILLIAAVVIYFVMKSSPKSGNTSSTTNQHPRQNSTETSLKQTTKNLLYQLCRFAEDEADVNIHIEPQMFTLYTDNLSLKDYEKLHELLPLCDENRRDTEAWGKLGRTLYMSTWDYSGNYDIGNQFRVCRNSITLVFLYYGNHIQSVQAMTLLGDMFDDGTPEERLFSIKMYRRAMEFGGEKEKENYVMQIRAQGLQCYRERILKDKPAGTFDPDKAIVCFREAVKYGEDNPLYRPAEEGLITLLLAEILGTRARYPDGIPDSRYYVENKFSAQFPYRYDDFYVDCNRFLMKDLTQKKANLSHVNPSMGTEVFLLLGDRYSRLLEHIKENTAKQVYMGSDRSDHFSLAMVMEQISGCYALGIGVQQSVATGEAWMRCKEKFYDNLKFNQYAPESLKKEELQETDLPHTIYSLTTYP